MTQPSAADWMTAIGTVGTLGATVTLFWIDRYQQRRRADKTQATLISAWAEPVQQGDVTRPVKVANLSTEPVYRVNVFIEDEFNRDAHDEVVPTAIGPDTANTRYISVVPPRLLMEFDLPRNSPSSPGPRSCPRVYLLFDDRNGRRWARDFTGAILSRRRDNPESHRPVKSATPTDAGPVKRSPIPAFGTDINT
jgi:hypothetical protein